MKKTSNPNALSRTWNTLPIMLRAIILGSLVSALGVGIWSAFFAGIKSPWAILLTAACLWFYWKWLRRRQTSLTRSVWKKGILLAALFVIIVQSSFVITYRLIEFPAAKFTADYKIIDTFPVWQAWLILIAGSIVAGICEELGFRGYMQEPMEKKYGPAPAIIVTSLIFTCTHLSHTWAHPILPHIFFASILLGLIAWRTNSLLPGIIGHSILDIFDYSIWWTDLTGGFTRRPISITGVDTHFIVFVLLFTAALAFFIRLLKPDTPKS
jgi:membrane protease YdiL (CAAX protease family)